MLVWGLEYPTIMIPYMDRTFGEKVGIITENTKKDYGCVVNGKIDKPNKGFISLGLMKMIWLKGIDFPKEWSSGTTKNTSCVSTRCNRDLFNGI